MSFDRNRLSRAKRGRRRDPIEQAMELALRIGDFIGYSASWEFVSGLEEVEAHPSRLAYDQLMKYVPKGGTSCVARQGDQCLGSGGSEFGHRIVARDQGDGTSGGTASRRLP
jgi:hypothetical protein